MNIFALLLIGVAPGPIIQLDSGSLLITGDGTLTQSHIRSIGAYDSIKDVTVTCNLNKIDDSAFYALGMLQTVLVHGLESLEVGRSAFQNCENLISLKIDCKYVILKSYVFSNCKSLKDVILGEGIQFVGDRCFSGCSSIEQLNFPDTLHKGTQLKNTLLEKMKKSSLFTLYI